MAQTLLSYVVSELNRAKGDWPRVSEASGVPVSTIHRIASGETSNPGVRQIEALASYFRGQAH